MIPFDKRDGKIWYNNKLVDWQDAKLHVISHGLHYASLVFEGLRVYEGEIFKLEEHTDRLYHSAKRMDIKIPYSKDEMNKAIDSPRSELGPYTPRVEMVKVKRDNIGEIIGKGGATIKDIIEQSGASVDISDNGTVKIAGTSKESIQKAIDLINSIIEEPEVGQVYEGKVVKIMEFGAFVNFFGKKDGLVHISQLSDERVEKVTDVINEGDTVKVKVIGFDKGKVKLSIKDVDA